MPENTSCPCVLVVEDDASVRTMLNVVLSSHGLRVLLAAGGADAVKLYRQHGRGIHVALIDVQMEPLDGLQTLAALRQLNPQLSALFMSGTIGQYTPSELQALDVRAILPKPFLDLAALARTVWDAATPPPAP